MVSTKPTLAFFGATGGCAGTALALALKDGYNCSALARTPSKLRKLLEEEHKVPATTLDSNLTIIQGSIKELDPVKQVLAPAKLQPASIVISGVGAIPAVKASILNPIAMEDPKVCQEGLTTVLAALRSLRRENVITEAQRPLLVAISSTGLSKTRDVPLAYYGLYHVLLKVPHEDKKAMESVIAKATTETGDDAPISGFVIPRPTLLVNGEAKGLDKVKAGWDTHPEAVNAKGVKGAKPAIGYSIRRADVGTWIFEQVVKGKGDWVNKCVSLTS